MLSLQEPSRTDTAENWTESAKNWTVSNHARAKPNEISVTRRHSKNSKIDYRD